MTEDTDRRGRRKRRDQAAATRDQLLAAARETFETRGYQAATVTAITSTANTAHGTFYLYFRNKEDAFARVMEDVAEELYREASGRWARGRPYESIEVATRGFLQVFVDHRGLWRALLEAILQSVSLERMWLDIRRRFVARISRNLRRLIDQGMIDPIDTDLTAHALGSMSEWFAFTHFVLEEPAVTATSFESAVRTLTEVWFRAVYGRVPTPLDLAGSSSGASAPM